MEKIDRRAETLWNRANKNFINYQNYISRKPNRFDISMVDLLYISNLKGGNGTIGEDENDLKLKLSPYISTLIHLDSTFKSKTLADLIDYEVKSLIQICHDAFLLTSHKETKISGVKISYLSALLNSYFPNLIPILDRRVLINTEIITSPDELSGNQVKNIGLYFEKLIRKMRIETRATGKTLRDLDFYYFIIKIDKSITGKPKK